MPIIPRDDDLLDIEIGRDGLDFEPAVELLDMDRPLAIGRRGPPPEVASAVGVERRGVPDSRGRGITVWDWEQAHARDGRGHPGRGRGRGITLREPRSRGRGRGRR